MVSYSMFSQLPDGGEADRLLDRVRAWEASRDDVTLHGVSQARTSSSGGGQVCYAGCGREDKCRARFKFMSTGEVMFKPHSDEGAHAFGPKIARASSKDPVSKESVEQIKQLASTHRNKRPLQLNMELEQPLPGRVVQRAVSKKRKSLDGEQRQLSLQELTAFLQASYVDLERDNVPQTGLATLWFETRQNYCGIVWTFGEMAYELGRLHKEQPQTSGFIGQTDYSGELVWSNAKIAIVGVQIFHRNRAQESQAKELRWRKVLLPLVFILNPFEDSDHYRMAFAWSRKLCFNIFTSMQLPIPRQLFDVIHGDWTRCLQKEYSEWLGCFVVMQVFLFSSSQEQHASILDG